MSCRSWALLLVSFPLCFGCGSKDSVALSAYFSQAELELEQVALGTALRGGFELTLELGPEASEATEVSLEAFALAPAGGPGELQVRFAPETTARFPLQLGVGALERVTFTVPAETLRPGGQAELCDGPVEIRGALRDTLSGGALTSVRSGAIQVTGCP